MRYIMRLGERGHGDEWNPESELIEARAFLGKRAGRVCRKGGAEVCGRRDTVAGRVHLIGGTLRAAARLGAGGQERSIGALSGRDAVRGPRVALRRPRRLDVIVEAAVLVIGYEDNRVFPVGTVAHRIDKLGQECRAALNVGRWVLVVLGRARKEAEIGIYEG